jgi:hypothetical protein
MIKPSTMLLLLLAATSISSARADETAPVSPTEKREEQKATMPPDMTTPTLVEPAKTAEQKTVVQTQKTSQNVAKAKCRQTKATCKTRTVVK